MNDCITNRTPDYLRAHADIEHEHEFDIEGEGWKSERTRTYEGMTIRQQFVMAAMQGLIARCPQDIWRIIDESHIAAEACRHADATLAEEARTRK